MTALSFVFAFVLMLGVLIFVHELGHFLVAKLARLDFEAPDAARFPCLGLAYAALASDELAPAVLNAANEEAVAAFLAGRVPFPAIAEIDAAVLGAHRAGGALRDLRDVLDVDAWARARAGEWLAGRAA